ncbi:MAG: FAD-binding protein [Actinomycetia bacterium]|nr:FAD-binding protein [Actinomycetes bacterium]
MPAAWDKEVDLVIVGFGGAGLTAAVEAKRAGASFLVLEKDPKARGGNTGCTGIHVIGVNQQACLDYFTSLCWGTTPDDVVKSHVAGMYELPDFYTSLGLTPTYSATKPQYPLIPGGDKFGGENAQYIIPESTAKLNTTFSLLAAAAKNEGVSVDDGNVMVSTPVVQLYQDPVSKEVVGVKAMTGVTTAEAPDFSWSGGTVLNVKAKKAVILACGGYENNKDMIGNFGPHVTGSFVTFYGTPFNTGDGINLATAVGAKLWHMNKKECHSLANAPATKEVGVGVVMTAYGPKTGATKSSIFVNRFGKRFQNESFDGGHSDRTQAWDHFTHWIEPNDNATYSDFPNNPFYWVFDQKMMDGGALLASLGGGPFRFAPQNGLITWSDNNQAEVDKGYILKGDTIEDLAKKIVAKDYFGRTVGVDPAALAATVDSFNSYAVAGNDPEFGRRAENMAPLDQGPFYAMQLIECQTNTDGGPERNANCQTIDVHGEIIPRLYNVGELGSMFGFLYNGGGNIPEAYATGRMAAKHALTLASQA